MGKECDEVTDEVLNKTFSQLGQDIAARKVANKLSAYVAPFNVRQGKKVRISVVGELKRSNDNLVTNDFPDGKNLTNKLRDMVKQWD